MIEHEHVHRTPDGLRRFRHSHPMPVLAADPNAARKHRHPNGEHSHPHGHKEYLR